MDVMITNAALQDAGELLTVQRAAYLGEAQRYNDPHLPALDRNPRRGARRHRG